MEGKGGGLKNYFSDEMFLIYKFINKYYTNIRIISLFDSSRLFLIAAVPIGKFYTCQNRAVFVVIDLKNHIRRVNCDKQFLIYINSNLRVFQYIYLFVLRIIHLTVSLSFSLIKV